MLSLSVLVAFFAVVSLMSYVSPFLCFLTSSGDMQLRLIIAEEIQPKSVTRILSGKQMPFGSPIRECARRRELAAQ
jgi:hypothetical protein